MKNIPIGPVGFQDMSGSLRLVELRIPFNNRFSNSYATLSERTVVLVGLTEDGLTGWGEAAPYPGLATETVEEVWEALSTRREDLPTTARVALEQAGFDLAARRKGVPLWSHLGGSGQAVPACAAIGLQETPSRLVARVDRMVYAGVRQVKIKIEPGRDTHWLEETLMKHPALSIAADANGSYRIENPALAALDELGLAYIEQPLPAGAIDDHAELRRRLATPICLDESAPTIESVGRIIDSQAADLVSLKPAILGIASTLSAIEMLVESGLEVKIGGLVETSVGRSHSLAIASRPQVSRTDLVPPTWLLSADPSPNRWELTDGLLAPFGLEGMEVDPDRPPINGYVIRTASFVY